MNIYVIMLLHFPVFVIFCPGEHVVGFTIRLLLLSLFPVEQNMQASKVEFLDCSLFGSS